MSDNSFTIEDGLAYQAKDLAFWRNILNDRAYTALECAVWNATAKAKKAGNLNTGHDVPRGQDLNSFILNIENDWNPLTGEHETEDPKGLLKEAHHALNAIISQYFTGPDGKDANTYALAAKLGKYLRNEPVTDDSLADCKECGKTFPADQLSGNGLCPSCVKAWIG